MQETTITCDHCGGKFIAPCPGITRVALRVERAGTCYGTNGWQVASGDWCEACYTAIVGHGPIPPKSDDPERPTLESLVRELIREESHG